MNFIKITEVGPRDGLQNEKAILSTEDKFKFIQLLSHSGLRNIEATSFVKKEWVPQMGDAQALGEKIFQEPSINSSIQFSCLTPNLKGYESALKTGFKEIAVFTATSETFSRKNTNRSVSDSLSSFQEIFKRASLDGIKVRAYISTVIACPYEGKMEPLRSAEIAKFLLGEGAYEISLGETLGVAVPSEVEVLLSILLKDFSPSQLACHFHDTYGMAIANVHQSLKMGIRSFDSSAGGLGGCPYAKGASGNLATEDLNYFLEREGYQTGISMRDLLLASSFIQDKIGRKLTSRTYTALSSG